MFRCQVSKEPPPLVPVPPVPEGPTSSSPLPVVESAPGDEPAPPLHAPSNMANPTRTPKATRFPHSSLQWRPTRRSSLYPADECARWTPQTIEGNYRTTPFAPSLGARTTKGD